MIVRPQEQLFLHTVELLEELGPARTAHLVHLRVRLEALLEDALRVLEQRVEHLQACNNGVSDAPIAPRCMITKLLMPSCRPQPCMRDCSTSLAIPETCVHNRYLQRMHLPNRSMREACCSCRLPTVSMERHCCNEAAMAQTVQPTFWTAPRTMGPATFRTKFTRNEGTYGRRGSRCARIVMLVRGRPSASIACPRLLAQSFDCPILFTTAALLH